MTTLAPLNTGRLPPLPSIRKPLQALQPVSALVKLPNDPKPRVTPLKIGIRFHPPSIAILYYDEKYGKRRVRQISSTELGPSPEAEKVLDNLQTKYKAYFGGIDAKKLEEIVQGIFEKTTEFSGSDELGFEEDLNKVSPEKLLTAKNRMNASFEQNRLRPGQDGFVYDKKEEFQPRQNNEWDEDDNDDGESEIEDDLNFSAAEATDDDAPY
jgi:hypothetical protein